MAKKVQLVLSQILKTVEGIERSLEGKSFDNFKSDWLLKHGIQRGLEIISEASRRIPPELLADHPDIPWRKIAAIGNILRHEYHAIQDEVVWDVAIHRLDDLTVAVKAMSARLDGEGSPP
jgi:uncharacterized protein with HEPN domain